MRSFFLSFIVMLLGSISIQAQTARVQVIHNSADAAASMVDVWLNNTLLLDDFSFRTASPFVDAPAGVPIEVRIKGSSSTDTTNPIAKYTYTLSQGETYVIVANGIVSGSGYNPATPFNLYVTNMGRESASNGSNTDVLVFHGATDAPAVDVAEVSAVNSGIVDDLTYGAFAGYLELPTADYKLQILDATATTPVAAYDAPLNTLGLQGTALVVLASGFLDPSMNSNGPAFGLYAALPSGGPLVALPSASNATSSVQIIHNSADLAAEMVDVWLNDVKLLDSFEFREASPFVNVPANIPLIVSVAAPGSSDTSAAIAQFSYTLVDGEQYIIIANGIVSTSGYNPVKPFDLYVYPMARTSASNSGNTDVLVFHGATDAPTVDVAETEVGAGTIVDDLPYGTFDGYLELPTDNYSLTVQDQSGSTDLFEYEAPLSTLNLEGAALTVLASGFVDPSQNSNGSSFGLYVALPSGGALVPLSLITGIESGNSSLQDFHISPNPATDVLHLDFSIPAADKVNYQLVAFSGQLYRNGSLGNLQAGQHNFSLNVSGLSPGMYFVNLRGAKGSTLNHVIIH